MITIFYLSLFTLSLICSSIYILIWHKRYDVNLTVIFTIVPIACLGYIFYYTAQNLYVILICQKVVYIGGCFLIFFMMMSIFNLCHITINKWLRFILFMICAILYMSVLTIGYTDLFYTDVSFDVINGFAILRREYGLMHTVFYIVIIAYFIIGMAAIIYSWRRKKQVPRSILGLLVLPEIFSVSFYFGIKINGQVIDIVPVSYILAQIVYIIIGNRISLYNVGETAIESMVRAQSIGYISFDTNYRYLGSNEAARFILPELSNLAVDNVFGYKPSERRIRHFLESFKKNPANNTFVYTLHGDSGDPDDERIYNVNVTDILSGARKRGYIITFTDDTANKKYIRLLDSYNEDLQSEVERKTKSIVEMHDNLIMSLAAMVESRDNSTGGHIRRTSVGVRILIDEIKKEGKLSLSEEFCNDVIKAAPMHDLGKIAVDDAVLRKPGRFTDEEYEQMKLHAAEGARVIHEILHNTDDESFKSVAENVAHYHHERWDGSGYPEKLSGEAIPFEARIMAIADVYDALVSKRVYKEAFDFERANNIIMEGMGTQFDPSLKTIYENARPRLEAYYSAV